MVRTKKQHRTTTHTGDRNYGKQQHRICTRWLLYLSHSTQSQCSFVRSFVRCFNKTNATTTTTRTKMEAQNTVDLFIKEHQRNKKENTNPRDWNDKFCLFQTFFFFLYFYAAAAAMNSFRLWFETTTTSTTSKLQKKNLHVIHGSLETDPLFHYGKMFFSFVIFLFYFCCSMRKKSVQTWQVEAVEQWPKQK